MTANLTEALRHFGEPEHQYRTMAGASKAMDWQAAAAPDAATEGGAPASK